MNWERIAGRWRQFKDRAGQPWSRPTEDQLEATADRKASEKQLGEWTAARHEIDPIHK
jgi:hypothetical protein